MRPVPVPHLAAPALRRPRRLAPLAAAAATALAAGALLAGARPHEAAPVAPAAPALGDGMLGGKPMQSALCAQWLRATAGEKQVFVQELAATVGGASTTGGYGTTLPDGEAIGVLDRQCASPKARHFMLYITYARAAAFSRQ